MRRLSLVPFLLATLPACHRSQAAPSPLAASVEAGALPRSIPSGDPSVLSESPETRTQIEPTLAVTGDGTVAIAWTSTYAEPGASIGVRFSSDGGTTWGAVQTVPSPDDRTASSPVLIANPAGDIYLAWLGTGPNGPGGTPDSHVYVARAAAGTGKMGSPVDVSDAKHRGSKITNPWLAVTAAGAVVTTWAYASPVGDGIGIARTLDGVKWSKGVVIERIDLRASLPYVCASARGDRVWIAYLDTEAGVRIRASDDGGVTWSPARVATVSRPEERALLAADTPVCTGDSDDVTVAYGRVRAQGTPGIDTISVAKSYDGGRTFDARRALDSASAPMMHPQLARESDGALDLAFYASGPSPDAGSLRWVRAADDKSPLGVPRMVRDHFRFEPSATESAWPGSYFGWAWHDGTLYAASIDNSADLPHVAFTKIPAR